MKLKGLLIDLDGSIYRGDQALPYSREFIIFLREKGMRFLFLTNNSTSLPSGYVEKLRKMGIEAKEEEILTSGVATAVYLKNWKKEGRVYIIGEEPLKEVIKKLNWEICEDNVDAVVVGLDRSFNFEKLKKANALIRSGARFIATNPDKTFPTEKEIGPGAGSLVAAVSAASQRKPIVIGKPSTYIGKIAMEKLGLSPEEIGIVGDRIDTDVYFGKRLKAKTFLLLTGITKKEDLEKAKVKPDFVFEDLKHLTDFLKEKI